MLLAKSGFLCICPQKSVCLDRKDGHLHRADHLAELHAELEFSREGITHDEYAYLSGGGLRAINPNSSMTLAQLDTCIAVFKGSLDNKADLCLAMGECQPGIKDADLLIKLYNKLGVDMLGHLHGQFAFTLYDSKQARVLAARDPSGKVPLVQGRTAAGSLIIACGTFMPEGVTQLEDIAPGQFKYGWHAQPRDYHVGVAHQPDTRRVANELGIRRRSTDVASKATPLRKSFDLHGTSQPVAMPLRRASHSGERSSWHPHGASAPAPRSRRSSEVNGTHQDRPHGAPVTAASLAAAAAAAAQAMCARSASSCDNSDAASSHSGGASEEAGTPGQHRHRRRHHHGRRGGRKSLDMPGLSSPVLQGARTSLDVVRSAPVHQEQQQQQGGKQSPAQLSKASPSQQKQHQQQQKLMVASDPPAARGHVKVDLDAFVGAPEFVPGRALGAPKRNGSCSDLAALSGMPGGSSPMLAPMHGLAC